MSLHDRLNEEPISRIPLTPPFAVSPSDPIRTVIERMRKERTGCILACEAGKLVGKFTERNFLERVIGAGADVDTPLSQFMIPDPETLRVTNTVNDAILLMEKGKYRHVPIVDQNDMPFGILSVKRIVHWLVEHYPTAVYNVHPSPDKVAIEREGA